MKCENLILTVQVRYKLRYARSSSVQCPYSTVSVELWDNSLLTSCIQLLIQIILLEVQNNLVKQRNRTESLLFMPLQKNSSIYPPWGREIHDQLKAQSTRPHRNTQGFFPGAACIFPSLQCPNPAHITPPVHCCTLRDHLGYARLQLPLNRAASS